MREGMRFSGRVASSNRKSNNSSIGQLPGLRSESRSMPDEPQRPDNPGDLLSPEEWRELLSPFETEGEERAVLVLTDRPDDAETIQAYLAPHGVKCQPARNCFTALDLFRNDDRGCTIWAITMGNNDMFFLHVPPKIKDITLL